MKNFVLVSMLFLAIGFIATLSGCTERQPPVQSTTENPLMGDGSGGEGPEKSGNVGKID